MKFIGRVNLGIGASCLLLASLAGADEAPSAASAPDDGSRVPIIDGVRQTDGTSKAVLAQGSVDFDSPALFSDTLPLEIFQTLRTEAVFVGTGAVLDVTSFEVTGTSDRTALAFNGRTAINGDGSVPRLPELVAFVTPDRTAFSPKQNVSVKVGSKRDAGQTVLLAAFDLSLNVVDFDFFTITPQMQTLTVSSPTSSIVLVGIFGSAELQVLVVDDLVYN